MNLGLEDVGERQGQRAVGKGDSEGGMCEGVSEDWPSGRSGGRADRGRPPTTMPRGWALNRGGR